MSEIQVSDIVRVGNRYAEITGFQLNKDGSIAYYYIRYFTGGNGSCPPALCEKAKGDIASLVAEEMNTSPSVALYIINLERRIATLEGSLRLMTKS